MKRAALFVGVNRYEDPEINPLQFAEADATELYAFFKHRAGYDDVRNLLNPDADMVLETASKMVSALGPGDLFLFFFAGHGVEFEKRHLLLFPKARYKRLRYFQNTVPVDLLKSETEAKGVHRVFILDACRSNLLSGMRSTKASGMRGTSTLRDICATNISSPHYGGFAILCACDEGQQSRELPDRQHGIFAASVLQLCERAWRGGEELAISGSLLTALQDELSRNLGTEAESQRPWLQVSGVLPPLLPSRQATGSTSAHHCIPTHDTVRDAASVSQPTGTAPIPTAGSAWASGSRAPLWFLAPALFVMTGVLAALREWDNWVFAGFLLPVALGAAKVGRSAVKAIVLPVLSAFTYLGVLALRYNAWEGLVAQVPVLGIMIIPHVLLGTALAVGARQGKEIK